MKKHHILLTIQLFISICLFAQSSVPSGYYDGTDGLSESELKTALYDIIKNHSSQSYSSLWTHMQTTDKREDGKVWDIYSDGATYSYTFGTNQCGNYGGEGDCYNREHSFPKSWFNDASPMYTDMYHLYPTDGYVNGKRSNYPFGEVDSPTWTSENGSKLGASSYPGYTGTVFEPIDEYKGDFARTYFYMATRYENVITNWNSAVLDGSSYPCYEEWCVNLLLEWHNNDPVSDKELARNEEIYQIQNNRNPFIDNPSFVTLIWGEAPNATDPNLSVSSTNVSDLNYEPGYGPSQSKSIVLNGVRLTGEVILTPSENIEFSLDDISYTNQVLSISPIDGAINAQNIYIRLREGLSNNIYPNEYIQLNSDGAPQVLINCSGTVACMQLTEPIANEATNINATFFNATWDAASNTDSYLLSAYAFSDGELDVEEDGDGSAENPFTIQQALDLPETSTVYFVKGYIVGGRYDDFDVPAANDYGISIASNSEEQTVTNCLQVKLETAMRSDWGMNSQPDKLGMTVVVKGQRNKYGGYPAFTSVSQIEELSGGEKTYLPDLEDKEVLGNSFVIDNLESETNYYYYVKAKSNCDDSYNSGNSNVIVATTVDVDMEVPMFSISSQTTEVIAGDELVISVNSEVAVNDYATIAMEIKGIDPDFYTLSNSVFEIEAGNNWSDITIFINNNLPITEDINFSISLTEASMGTFIAYPTMLNVSLLTNSTDVSSTIGLSKVYPNPFNESLTIESESIIMSYEIYSISGILVYQKNSSGGHKEVVNTSFLEKGSYLIRIKTQDGYTTKTIVK